MIEHAPDLAPSLPDVIADARWLSFGFDPSTLTMHFVNVDDALLDQTTFIDAAWIKTRPTVGFPLDQVAQALADSARVGPRAMILHTAFSCSTLFARCLQIPGEIRVIRELPLLSGLAAAASALAYNSRVADGQDWQRLLDVAAVLPSRVFPGETATFNKPSNVFLAAAPDFFSRHGDIRAVVIHNDLPGFLVSCLKKVHLGPAPWLGMLRGLQPGLEILRHLDLAPDRAHPLQLAGVVWHLQMRILRILSQQDAGQRLRQLSAATFLEDPRAATQAAKRWMAPTIQSEIPESVFARELSRHAKRPDLAFDADRRSEEASRAGSDSSELLQQGMHWCAQVFGAWEPAYDTGIAALTIAPMAQMPAGSESSDVTF